MFFVVYRRDFVNKLFMYLSIYISKDFDQTANHLNNNQIVPQIEIDEVANANPQPIPAIIID